MAQVLGSLTRISWEVSQKSVRQICNDKGSWVWRSTLVPVGALENRPTSNYHLSPGDLDKAISALLIFRGSGDVQRQGQGSDRVDAYRDGVFNGAKACLTR